jgi:hypothetical protein
MYLVKNGQYAQVELNQVAFPRDGRIEAQCALSDEFSENKPAENGMILVVDNEDRVIRFPAEGTDEPGTIYALNYTAEHMYDERELGSLRYFKLVPGTFYPRLGYLAVGDKFTTNAIAVNEEGLDALKGKIVVPGTTGYWTEGTIDSRAVAAKVIAITTMPDGQKAVKLQVVKA